MGLGSIQMPTYSTTTIDMGYRLWNDMLDTYILQTDWMYYVLYVMLTLQK